MNKEKIKVIAIDNKSDDESVEYLRSLPWITLIERDPGSEAADRVKAICECYNMSVEELKTSSLKGSPAVDQ